MPKFPLGVQYFPKLRKEGYLYVDKTRWLARLLEEGSIYFLSRPRRFGKSLLISTLKALLEGQRDLFSGLWIDSITYEWREFPVIHLDLSKTVCSPKEALAISLQELLNEVALQFGIVNIQRPFPSLTLSALVIELFKKGPVVILIDEYDKPLVHDLDDKELNQHNRDLLKDFYSTIKALDQYLRFVFITGVSKFSKVSLFSGMNNIKDLSLDESYAELLGITDAEIESHLMPTIDRIAKGRNESRETILKLIKTWYNGYQFSSSSQTTKVYNPISLFSFLDSGKLDNYWFTTATPTFAIELIRKQGFPIVDLERGILAGREIESSHEIDEIDIPTLLLQTGYLTIRSFDEKTQTFFLAFPNEEVKRSFLEHLLDLFTKKPAYEVQSLLYKLSQYLEQEDLKEFFHGFNLLLSSIPYQIHIDSEAYYHSLLYLFLKVIGFKVEAEISTHNGRIDMLLKTPTSVLIFEFKINRNARAALHQIQKREYHKQFASEHRRILLIGVNFNTKTRSLDDWRQSLV